jgi:tRNA-dihydrouridine synthase 1
MVGASELAFRLLCRKYGTQLAYTPMMAANQFAHDAVYRASEFQTCSLDRPLVCHFWANTPKDFAAAAVAAAPYCDAVDLNLGCPQKTAYVGHFGSYLLDDRPLLCAMVRAAALAAPTLPIFCKIRLLAKVEDTVRLVRELSAAGASLVAIHGRYKASWERKGAGARDGPAHLDQVAQVVRELVPDCKIVTNGNTVTWKDVSDNFELTRADGLMSAEGILDNPALFLPRFGDRAGGGEDVVVKVPVIPECDPSEERIEKKKRKLLKKLQEVERLQEKEKLNESEREKVSNKASLTKKFAKLEALASSDSSDKNKVTSQKTVKLSALYEAADDKVALAREYLDLATRYPVKMRSVIFHIRRMLKESLAKYQLLEDCLACKSIPDIRAILDKITGYSADTASFVFDQAKARKEKETLERKKAQEGKRRDFEARLMRKAKREGKEDLTYYLRIGADVPTVETVEKVKELLQTNRTEALAVWKAHNHAQHCFAFHLQEDGCPRGRTCAFLHVDASGGNNSFVEQEEVAG